MRAAGYCRFAYGHRGDQMIANGSPANVRVSPGGSAYFELNNKTCVGFTNRVARTIRVTLPGARGSLSLRLAHYPIIDYCPTNDPGHGITLSPRAATGSCTSYFAAIRSDEYRAPLG